MSDIRPSYTLDARDMVSRDAAFAQLFSVLPLPPSCGHNLDALADVLWELPPSDVIILHSDALSSDGPLGIWGDALRRVLIDVAIARGDDFDIVLRH